MKKFTGKDLYTLLAPNTEDYLTWRELTREEQEEIEKAATRIHDTHIAPLQGVMQELVELLKDPDLMIEDSADDWYKRKLEALIEAEKLLAVRKHQYRLKRNYQFPNATSFIQDGQNVGWVVNTIYQKDLYGVVRYSPHGDDVAWIESESFGADKDAAEKWIRETLQQIKEELQQFQPA